MKEILMTHIKALLKINEEQIEINRNKDYPDIENNILREKMLVINSYYDFLENKSALDFIEKSYNILKECGIGLKINDLIELVVIIFKGFVKDMDKEGKYIVDSTDIVNYISEEYYKYMILSKIYTTKKKTSIIGIHSLDILCNHNIIKQDIKTYYNMGRKSYKYYSIYIENYWTHPFNFFEISFTEFEWIEINDKYYIYTVHYSKMHEFNKSNFQSNKHFKVKDVNYFIKKINIRLYVDKEYQEDIKKLYKEEVGVMKLDIRKKIEELKNLYITEKWTSETKNKITNCQKEISKINEKIAIIAFSNYDFKDMSIYFPLFLDFRGRKNYRSIIGPTNSKITRLSYYYGWYTEKEILENKRKYSLEYDSVINRFCEENKINSNNEYKEGIFWCLIGIGKHYIEKNKIPIKTEEFLIKGIENYNKEVYKFKIAKELEIRHYKRIIKSFSSDKIKKRVIIKDATASVYQIFMKKIGPKNDESMKYVNLGELNEWYDTYAVNSNFFYKYITENKIFKDFHNINVFNKFFSRDLIKNTIMIIPYTAGSDLCWKNYIKKIKEEEVINNINEKDLKKIFKHFYKYIKFSIQENVFYSKSTNSMIDIINEEFEEMRKYILESEEGEADISYYKMKKSSIDKKYFLEGKAKRITKLILIPSKALDIKEFNASSGANTAHFYDANEVRSIEKILGYCIITIHDSYLIDILSCTKLIDAKLEHYRKEMKLYKNKINNIFILL